MGTLFWTLVVVLVAWWLVKHWDFVEELLKSIYGLLGILLITTLVILVTWGGHAVATRLMGNGVGAWIITITLLITICTCLFKHNG